MLLFEAKWFSNYNVGHQEENTSVL